MVDQAAIGAGFQKIRPHLERGRVAVQGFFQPIQGPQHIAAIVESVGKPAIQGQGAIAAVQRGGQVLELKVDQTQVVGAVTMRGRPAGMPLACGGADCPANFCPYIVIVRKDRRIKL